MLAWGAGARLAIPDHGLRQASQSEQNLPDSLRAEADPDARARIARRLRLAALDRFVVTAEIRTIAGGIGIVLLARRRRVAENSAPLSADEQARLEALTRQGD